MYEGVNNDEAEGESKHQDRHVVRKLKKITVVSVLFMTVQLVGGYFAHSIAILADAFHLLSDVLAYSISLVAVLMSSRPASPSLSFGYEKIQPLGALINVLIIWVVTVFLAWQATARIIDKSVVQQPFYMLLTSLFGLACNLYIMQILHSDSHHGCNHHHHHAKTIKLIESQVVQRQVAQGGQQLTQKIQIRQGVQRKQGVQKKQRSEHKFTNINMQAAYIHILTDIILSVGVILSASIIYFFAPEGWSYWQLADPLCTYFFSLMAIYSTVSIAQEALLLLIDGFAHPKLALEIQKQLKDVVGNHYAGLRLWSTNRTKHYAMLRIKDASKKKHVQHIFTIRNIVSYIHISDD